MNRITKTTVNWIIGIAMVIALGYAGGVDYREDVISSMSQELYDKVKFDLGGRASESEIVEKYIGDKEMYESLGI